jgi:predicted helicase
MKLSKDRCSVLVNESLRLDGVPTETFEYRVCNRRALEWGGDQPRAADQRAGVKFATSDSFLCCKPWVVTIFVAVLLAVIGLVYLLTRATVIAKSDEGKL